MKNLKDYLKTKRRITKIFNEKQKTEKYEIAYPQLKTIENKF